MRPLGPIGTGRAAQTALAGIAGLVLSAGAASAMCSGAPGVNILASDGETCDAIGTYSSSDVPAGQATGAGSVLTWPGEGSVSFSTSGPDTPAIQADTGGSVMLNVTPPYTGTATTTGEGSIGLYATGSGSTEEGTVASSISVTNFTISTQNLGDYSIPIYASQGGQITVTGGSATSVGDSSFGAAVVGGGTINLTGTTILTTGDGSAGMIINGAGGVINATDVSITTHGNVDTSLSNYADGAYNGPFGDTYPTGGTLTIRQLDDHDNGSIRERCGHRRRWDHNHQRQLDHYDGDRRLRRRVVQRREHLAERRLRDDVGWRRDRPLC
jgi:autotransporter family porin